MTASGAPYLRIGALAERTGVPIPTLRAWEERYGLFRPARTSGGFRLYSDGDELRARRMRRLTSDGVAAAQAAALVLDGDGAREEHTSVSLIEAIDQFDASGVQAALDACLGSAPLDGIERHVFPVLDELGHRFERGIDAIAQEHFASSLVRGRLLELSRGWDRGRGPEALIACLPGERHDLGALALGLALRECGIRITFLGADTPVPTVAAVAARIDPSVIVLSASMPRVLEDARGDVATLARTRSVVVAGPADGPVARGARRAPPTASPSEVAREVVATRLREAPAAPADPPPPGS